MSLESGPPIACSFYGFQCGCSHWEYPSQKLAFVVFGGRSKYISKATRCSKRADLLFMSSLVTLALMLCLRACLCCAVYGALRLLGRSSLSALRGLGWFALVLWALAFVFFALMECLLAEGFSLGEPEPEITYPVAFIANVGTGLATTLGVGSLLLRYATQKQWN